MKLFLGALLGVLAIPAFANMVTVTNFSFEDVPGSAKLNPCGTGCNYTVADTNPIPGWVFAGDSTSCAPTPGCAGQFDPGVSDGNTTYYTNPIPNGNWIAYLNSGNLTQTVGSVEANTTYTLSVAEGLRNDISTTLGTAELLIGTTPYITTGITPAVGGWSTFTVVYNSTMADFGKSITIKLLDSTNTAQANFDNVVLTKTAMPEPTSIAEFSTMLAALGLGLTMWRRRRV